MTRYRLLPSAARRYPALDPAEVYEADGQPSDIGGIMLLVPTGKSPRMVWLRDLEKVPD